MSLRELALAGPKKPVKKSTKKKKTSKPKAEKPKKENSDLDGINEIFTEKNLNEYVKWLRKIVPEDYPLQASTIRQLQNYKKHHQLIYPIRLFEMFLSESIKKKKK